jgi:hypothetical protein
VTVFRLLAIIRPQRLRNFATYWTNETANFEGIESRKKPIYGTPKIERTKRSIALD